MMLAEHHPFTWPFDPTRRAWMGNGPPSTHRCGL